MGNARPAGLDRLGGERPAPFEDRERGHHRQRAAEIGEHLLDRVQAGLEDERVEGRLREEEIHATVDEGLDLLAVGRHHLVERHVSVAGVGHVAGNGELLVGRADRPGHEAGPVGRLGRGRVGRRPGQRRGDEVHLPGVVLEAEVGQGHARRPERVGLDNVGARLQVGGVDVADRVPLRERQDVDAVLQVAVVVGEPGSAKAGLVEGQLVHHRAHGAVEDGDPVGEDGTEEIGTGGGWHRRSGSDGKADESRPGAA